ncbi:MAG: class I SAM-dependent methyltransferase [Bacteroidota bacterium]
MSKNRYEKNKVIKNYRKLFIEHKEGAAVGQWSLEGQLFRFEKLSQIAPLTDMRILEIGCGIGDFYPFLKKKYTNCYYTGIDIVPELIEFASNKYPDATFLCLDLLEDDFVDKFDYVLISGVFNNNIKNSSELLYNLISTAYKLAEKGIAFNFISKYAGFYDDGMAYHDPVDILKFCIEKLSPKTTVFHHYERCDVTVFVYN